VGKGAKAQTIGYKYFMSLLMGFGRGPMSEIVQINVGGKVAWAGPLVKGGGTDIGLIRNAELFGGDKKEGGIYGPFRVLWGDADQVLPGATATSLGTLPGIAASIGTVTPAMRGVTTLWYDGEVCSMNPYPKEWKARIRRSVDGWYGGTAWYPQKAVVGLTSPEIVSYTQAAERGILDVFLAKGGSRKNNVVISLPGSVKAQNGAHIIYECITNPEWGRGIEAELLDENSFIYAANQMCDEGLGLCFFWARQEDVDVFIQTVLDHIGGVLYTDRSTGLLTLRLIRDDYDPEALPTFSKGNGLLDILLDDSGSQDIAYNEVIVKYHDPVSDTDGEARAQNVGARIAQGSSNSLSKEYPGFPTKSLAARAAVRELIVQSSGLKKYKVRLDRSGWRIAPGMPFRIVSPERNIGTIILRAGEIADSSAQQGGDIQISALEDVFSMPSTSMVVPEDPVWVPPVTEAVPPDASVGFELSYYDLAKRLSQFDIPNVDDADSYLGVMAAQPVSTQVLYDLMYRDPGDLEWLGGDRSFSFTGTAVLADDITPYQTAITLDDISQFPADVLGDSMMIGNERVRIDAFDPVLGTMTIARGVIDTIPQAHAAGDRIWLPDDDLSSNEVIYSPGEIVEAAAATRANSGVILEEDYDILTVEMEQRVGRPYPVGDLQVDGTPIFSIGTTEYPEPEFTWTTRNRVLQADQLIAHGDGSITEEDGTTYEVEIKDLADVVLRTEPLPAGTVTWTYDAAMQAADGDPPQVIVDVRPVRADLRPLYPYNAKVVLKSGYGYGYGLNYGGA
jgi:hypothetical protein